MGAFKDYQPISDGKGKLGRYVYSFNERDLIPRKQLDISGIGGSETDMGSQAGLVSFLQEGQKLERELYPDGNVRRMFIFVDHGGGSLNGVCFDAYTGNGLNLQELKNAFAQVQDDWANPDVKPFEVVAFDACLISTYETAKSLKDTANYMVASQEVTFGKVMFDYTGLLNELSANLSMIGAQLGKIICDTCREDSLRIDDEFDWRMQDVLTMSVTDLSKIDNVTKALMNFGAAGLKYAEDRSKKGGSILAPLSSAALKAENYSNDTVRREYYHMVDLKDFAAQVKQTRTLFDYPKLARASNDLIKEIDDAIIYNVRGDALKHGGGLSFVYPYDVRENAIKGYESLANNGFGVQTKKNLYKLMSEESKKDLFNLSDLEKVPVTVNRNKNSVAIKLDKNQMERIAGVVGARHGVFEQIRRDELLSIKSGDIITPQYVFFKINFVALAKAFKVDTFIEKYGDDPKSWTAAHIKEMQDMLTAEGLIEAGELTKRGEEIMEANFDGGIKPL